MPQATHMAELAMRHSLVSAMRRRASSSVLRSACASCSWYEVPGGARESSIKAPMEDGAAVAASAVVLAEVGKGPREGVGGLDDAPPGVRRLGLCVR